MRAYVEAIHFYKTRRDDSIKMMQQYMNGLPWDETAYLYEEGLSATRRAGPERPGARDWDGAGLDPPVTDMKPSDFYDISFLQEMGAGGVHQGALQTVGHGRGHGCAQYNSSSGNEAFAGARKWAANGAVKEVGDGPGKFGTSPSAPRTPGKSPTSTSTRLA